MRLTKDVIISIKGLQFADSEVRENVTDEELDQIETICLGEYHYQNGAHFIMYEEAVEEFPEPVRNMIKLREHEFVLTKKGSVNMQMVFSEGKKTMSDYVTPFGNILIALDTKTIRMDESQNSMKVHIAYGLEANYQFIADCDITVEIRSRSDHQTT